MEFGFSNFDEFMNFVETEGKSIENWSEKDIAGFNEKVWKLEENIDFKKRYDAWIKKIMADSQKQKKSSRPTTTRRKSVSREREIW